MVAIMGSSTELELEVIALILQRLCHFLVGYRPVTELVVEIIVAILKVDTNRFLFGFTNDVRVGVTMTNINEAADVTDHFGELVGFLPSRRERANAATTGAADCPTGRVFGDFVFGFDLG